MKPFGCILSINPKQTSGVDLPNNPDTQACPEHELDLRQLLDEGKFHAAFEGIVDQFQSKVFRLAYSMTRNRARAEDLAQESFLRVWKGLPGYDGRAALSTWIYTIARNTCYTELRRHAARPSVSMDDPDQATSLETDSAMAVRDRAGGSSLDIAELLQRLTERQRQVVTLFYLEQKSHEETAALLGMPVGSVKTLLHRTKLQFGRMLATRPSETNSRTKTDSR
jgi:RNA polymerase sigma-70 factor (ECF subfamily)